MDYVVSHLYVANPQARIGAIQTMTMEAYHVLKAKGMVPCTNFKTAETYSFQYISACEATMGLIIFCSLPLLIVNRLLDIYVTQFRSRVQSNNSDRNFVFLSAQGSRMTNLGRSVLSHPSNRSIDCQSFRCINRFFKKYDLHITTTGLRSVSSFYYDVLFS